MNLGKPRTVDLSENSPTWDRLAALLGESDPELLELATAFRRDAEWPSVTLEAKVRRTKAHPQGAPDLGRWGGIFKYRAHGLQLVAGLFDALDRLDALDRRVVAAGLASGDVVAGDPPDVAPRGSGSLGLRPAVLRFACAMETKLRKHDSDRGPDGWLDCSRTWLLERIDQERDELARAVETGHRGTIAAEAVDVANFAMMLFDVLPDADKARAAFPQDDLLPRHDAAYHRGRAEVFGDPLYLVVDRNEDGRRVAVPEIRVLELVRRVLALDEVVFDGAWTAAGAVGDGMSELEEAARAVRDEADGLLEVGNRSGPGPRIAEDPDLAVPLTAAARLREVAVGGRFLDEPDARFLREVAAALEWAKLEDDRATLERRSRAAEHRGSQVVVVDGRRYAVDAELAALLARAACALSPDAVEELRGHVRSCGMPDLDELEGAARELRASMLEVTLEGPAVPGDAGDLFSDPTPLEAAREAFPEVEWDASDPHAVEGRVGPLEVTVSDVEDDDDGPVLGVMVCAVYDPEAEPVTDEPPPGAVGSSELYVLDRNTKDAAAIRLAVRDAADLVGILADDCRGAYLDQQRGWRLASRKAGE